MSEESPWGKLQVHYTPSGETAYVGGTLVGVTDHLVGRARYVRLILEGESRDDKTQFVQESFPVSPGYKTLADYQSRYGTHVFLYHKAGWITWGETSVPRTSGRDINARLKEWAERF